MTAHRIAGYPAEAYCCPDFNRRTVFLFSSVLAVAKFFEDLSEFFSINSVSA